MNSTLILSFAIISLIGMLIFWLLYRKSNVAQHQTQKYLLKQLKDQSITPEQRSIHEKQLSDALISHQSQNSMPVLFVVAFLLIGFSFYFYSKLGSPEAIGAIETISQNRQQGQAPQISMEDAVMQLEAKLTENPNDVDGQILYARSQVSMKSYEKAVKAYRKANELSPNQPIILTELAESIALFNDNRSFLGEPEGLLKQAISIDEANQKALWLYGMTFYEKKEFAKTNELWTKLYQLIDNESAKQQLQQQLNDVRAKLGISTDIIAKDETIESMQLTVNIGYDTEKLPPQKIKRATLYLYTKATTGMPMPIAVIQKPLEVLNNAFPLQLTLSDLNNLQATRKLSEFENIIIGARISFSGNALPQPGDLQSSEIEIQLPYSKNIELVIDQVKK